MVLSRSRKDCHVDIKGDSASLRDQAARLLALALRARENGNIDVSNDLALLASEAFGQADKLERAADD
jgi:hypothetical protein